MVLRINGAASVLSGVSRSNEARIWKAASKEGIAPPLLHIDNQNRFLVSSYMENILPPEPARNQSIVDQALILLKRCHQLKVEAPEIDYFSHIENYWRIIESKKANPNPTLYQQRAPMQQLLGELTASNPTMGLCHHDPVIANFVGSTERLYLIDWEYAATGLQIMDYAALATEWEIDEAVILARSGCNPEHLTMAKTLYEYLCYLWKATTT